MDCIGNSSLCINICIYRNGYAPLRMREKLNESTEWKTIWEHSKCKFMQLTKFCIIFLYISIPVWICFASSWSAINEMELFCLKDSQCITWNGVFYSCILLSNVFKLLVFFSNRNIVYKLCIWLITIRYVLINISIVFFRSVVHMVIPWASLFGFFCRNTKKNLKHRTDSHPDKKEKY